MICIEETTESTFHIYYRFKGWGPNPSPRDHIIKNGEALCNHDVSVPEKERLKPINEVSESEWAVLLSGHSNLCDECTTSVNHYDVVPEDLPEPPEFTCPLCDEKADNVDFSHNTVKIYHMDGLQSMPPSVETHQTRRERFDLWRTNPDEPFTYSKLKQFIDSHPHIYRPKEYRKTKREARQQKS
jgi:hypothetical protein